MFGLIREVTDTFSFSEWNVLWVDDKGESHGKRFYYKTEARFEAVNIYSPVLP